MSNIAFLGLGAMGQRMAGRLLDAGHAVTVWNRSPAAAGSLLARGAVWADTPRAAVAQAQVAISMVYDDAASRSVWLDGDAGAAGGLPAGALAIECSTLSPAWVAQLAGRLGPGFIDAPVAGSRPQAGAGQLVFMAGGAADAVERATPVLKDMGSAVHHLGPAGSGAWLKLSVNALFGTQVTAMAEQLALLRSAGLDTGRVLAALRAMPVTSPAAAGAAAGMLAGDFAPQAPVDLIAKDLAYGLDAAAGLGLRLPLARQVLDRFQAAQAGGLGAANLTAVARLYA